MQFDVSSIQLQGSRGLQQDRLITRQAGDGSLLVLIADGLGGHPHAEWAAESAISAAAGVLFHRLNSDLDSAEDAIAHAFSAADEAVFKTVPAKSFDPPATTLICGVFRKDRMWFGSLGDSLIIRRRKKIDILNSSNRTLDAVVGSNFERAIILFGDDEVYAGDTYLFASDGVDSGNLKSATAGALELPTARQCAEAIALNVIRAGTERQDNVTAVVVKIQTPSSA